MNNNNTYSKESFLDTINHPRKRELAEMIFEGSSEEEFTEKGFAKINVQEMTTKINQNVVKEELPEAPEVEEVVEDDDEVKTEEEKVVENIETSEPVVEGDLPTPTVAPVETPEVEEDVKTEEITNDNPTV